MALSSCFAYHPQISSKINCRVLVHKNHHQARLSPSLVLSLQGVGTEIYSQKLPKLRAEVRHGCCFLGGLRIDIRPTVNKSTFSRKNAGACYSWLSNPQVASSAFTLGTAAILPFYTLMIVAPKAELLQGIAKMFTSEMTLASSWIHLLVVDLFAARHVYHDGLEKEVETRHSVSMCLLFCPVGILSHLITTTLTRPADKTRHSDTII